MLSASWILSSSASKRSVRLISAEVGSRYPAANTLMADYVTQHLQGSGNRGRMVQSRLRVPFKPRAVTVVVSGPIHSRRAQRFAVSWAAGNDHTSCTFAGELYVGRGIVPDSGSLVLSGTFLSGAARGNRVAGAGRSIALAVGHALLLQLRVAIGGFYGIGDVGGAAIAYAWRYMN